jgi:hypothetical protein
MKLGFPALPPLCHPVPPPVSSRSRSPHGKFEQSNNPNCFPQLLAQIFYKYDSIGAFLFLAEQKKQTKNPIM